MRYEFFPSSKVPQGVPLYNFRTVLTPCSTVLKFGWQIDVLVFCSYHIVYKPSELKHYRGFSQIRILFSCIFRDPIGSQVYGLKSAVTRVLLEKYLSTQHAFNIYIHSSPKETQLFWSCLSFGEECAPFNFRPKVICRMLLVAICQRPHSQIPHGSCTLKICLSTSRHRKITKLGSSSKFGSCISFWEECISVNHGSYNISPVHLVTTCKKAPFKNSSWLSHNLKMFE